MNTQKKVSECLKEAFAKIDSKEKWTQGQFARDAEGKGVSEEAEDAVCFCSLGAFRAVANVTGACKLLTQAMEENIVRFNDSHTYEEVYEAWQRAIKRAELKEEWERPASMG